MVTGKEDSAMSQKRATLYASAGSVITQYELDVEGCALVKRASVTLPNRVHYAWPHSSKPFLYAICSSRTSRTEVDSDHCICALKIDAATGAVSMHGKPIPLPVRALHVTTDRPSQYVLLCSNVPSRLFVFRIQSDGTLGELVPQRPDLDLGVVPHQVRVTADNRMVILVTRGNPADRSSMPHQGSQRDPGALKVFEYRDGVLGKEVSVAPGDGYGFGPRHLDFHPAGPWVYVSLETQNELHVFKREGDTLLRNPLFTRPILADAANTRWRQSSGTVHLHPNGRIVYCANRCNVTQPFDDKQVVMDADNSLAVYSIDNRSGEPSTIQHIGSAGISPRTFALDPGGRVLVVANSEAHWYKDGDQVRWMPANLAVFRVLDDGRLDFRRKYDVELGPEESLLWMGIVTY